LAFAGEEASQTGLHPLVNTQQGPDQQAPDRMDTGTVGKINGLPMDMDSMANIAYPMVSGAYY
jgi:hypothetical protein